MKLGLKNIKNWTTERISQRVLYVLVALSAVLFLLFYTVGYNRPFEDDPDFKSPLFTDVLLIFMFLLVIGAIAMAVWAMLRDAKIKAGCESGVENNVPVRKINRYVLWGTIGIVFISFLVGSTEVLTINGKPYTDWLWLKVSDLFVYTSVFLLLAAVVAVIYGTTRYYRKEKK